MSLTLNQSNFNRKRRFSWKKCARWHVSGPLKCGLRSLKGGRMRIVKKLNFFFIFKLPSTPPEGNQKVLFNKKYQNSTLLTPTCHLFNTNLKALNLTLALKGRCQRTDGWPTPLTIILLGNSSNNDNNNKMAIVKYKSIKRKLNRKSSDIPLAKSAVWRHRLSPAPFHRQHQSSIDFT